MKRHGDIMDKIYHYDNLYKAYKKAKRGKSWYKDVLEFEENLENNLLILQYDLMYKEYKTSQYVIFEKKCGNKVREICKLPFYPDRICQWAIMLQLEDILLKQFTRDTYSAIPKRGIHLALRRLKKELRKDSDGMRYCLKLDIKKYYPNINHEVLKSKLTHLFKDKELLYLLSEIIDSLPNGKGLPIGNYTSQYLANFYLSSFDRWVKEDENVTHYFRYMDDILLFSDNKEQLHKLLAEIKSYLSDELKLELKGNEQIFPVEKRGIDFVGYVVYPTHVKIRKSIKQKMVAKMNRLSKKDFLTKSDRLSIGSYNGWLIHCDSKNLSKKYIAPFTKED